MPHFVQSEFVKRDVNVTKYYFILFTDSLGRGEWTRADLQLIKRKMKWVVNEFAKKKITEYWK